MLEYIAIANAAYKTIRSAIQNGRELHSVGKQIAAFTTATDEISKGKDKKKNSIWSKFTGKDESDLEEFMHLEDLKKKEEELKQLMIYLGRPGLHSDWVKFQVEARKKRQQEEKEREIKKKELMETLWMLTWIIGGAVVGGIALIIGIKVYMG